jgi:hypothetical protein
VFGELFARLGKRLFTDRRVGRLALEHAQEALSFDLEGCGAHIEQKANADRKTENALPGKMGCMKATGLLELWGMQ